MRSFLTMGDLIGAIAGYIGSRDSRVPPRPPPARRRFVAASRVQMCSAFGAAFPALGLVRVGGGALQENTVDTAAGVPYGRAAASSLDPSRPHGREHRSQLFGHAAGNAFFE